MSTPIVRDAASGGVSAVDQTDAKNDGQEPLAEGPLPAVDDASILQEESLVALRAVFPHGQYLFREQLTRDYGVDVTVEIVAQGRATNLNAQLQLKARTGLKASRDGAFSVSVKTANLNYLMNGSCPHYVLYIPEEKQLLIADARQELRRVEEAGVDWRAQGTIAIRFSEPLDEARVLKLRNAIAAEGRLRRALQEQITSLRLPQSEVTLGPDRRSLQNTEEILRELSGSGQSLTNGGLAARVVELGRRVPEATLFSDGPAALAFAYAQFHLAAYFDAAATIRRVLLARPSMSPEASSLLNAMFISVRRMLGELDDEAFERELAEWMLTATGELATQYRLTRAWRTYHGALASGAEPGPAVLSDLRGAIAAGLSLAEPVRSHAELLALTLAQHEMSDTGLDAMALAELANHLPVSATAVETARAGADRAREDWEQRLAKLLERTQSRAPNTHMEAVILRIHDRLETTSRRQLATLTGRGQPLPANEAELLLAMIEQATELALGIKNHEHILSAEQCRATALDMFGDPARATEVARDALRVAELTGCTTHARQLREFVRGGDRFLDRLATLAAMAGMPDDELVRGLSDAQVEYFAQTTAKAQGLSVEAARNLGLGLRAHRESSMQRRSWCRHLTHAEYRRHSGEPIHERPPQLRVVCMKLRHEGRIDVGTLDAILPEFKQQFCSGCGHRAPEPGPDAKAAGPQSARNRAKAARQADRKRRR